MRGVSEIMISVETRPETVIRTTTGVLGRVLCLWSLSSTRKSGFYLVVPLFNDLYTGLPVFFFPVSWSVALLHSFVQTGEQLYLNWSLVPS